MSLFNRYSPLILMVIFSFSFTSNSFARSFHVEDSNGQPLQDAVVIVPAPSNGPPAEAAIMDQVNNAFVPYVLVIQKGQEVTFPNSDRRRHHVYSFSPAKSFEIKLYAGEPEAPVLFDKTGIVVLGCNIHDSMLAYIVVVDSPLAGTTDAQGNLTLADSPAPASIQVWHPLMQTPAPELVTIPLPAADAQGTHLIRLQVQVPAAKSRRTLFDNRMHSGHGA